MERREHLLLVGASVRAAAFAALRAGLRPWCVDLFADADLRARCLVVAAASATYPNSLREAAAAAPPGPWMYTGALENYPRLVEQLSATRPLWGNDARALRAVRRPQMLADTFRAAGIPFPAVDGAIVPRPGSAVLIKPLKGSAGRQIDFAGKATMWKSGTYQQEFIAGDSIAAVYVGDGKAAGLVGVTRQLTGLDWLHAKRFAYCGSIGPMRPRVVVEARLKKIGNVLARACGLRGLFGVDCILQGDTPWPVEVNPRYTASVEVLEYATGLRPLELHRGVFAGGAFPLGPPATEAERYVGKAILFAREAFTFPRRGPWDPALDGTAAVDRMPAFADVPRPGQPIRGGAPILTLLTNGDSPRHCLETLKEIARDLDRRLFGG
jgi:predicted ATP-grasp superfamily ATP-dependent carboligase